MESTDTDTQAKGEQGSLTDNFRNTGSDDQTPEDIEREFGIPSDAGLQVFDIGAEELIEITKQPWEEAREVASNGSLSYSHPDHNKDILSFSIDTDLLRIIHNHIKPVVSEYKLTIRENGLHVIAIDKSNVQTIEVWLDKQDLNSYTVNHETTIGLSSRIFERVLSHTTAGSLNMEVAQDRKITIEDGFTTETGLIDPDSIRSCSSNIIFDMNYLTEATLPGVDLYEILSETDSDRLLIKTNADKNSITFGTQKENQDEETVEIDRDSYSKHYESYKDLCEYRDRSISQYNFSITVAESTVSQYSVGYLKNLVECNKTNLRTDYRIEVDDNMPIKVTRNLRENSHIISITAPNVTGL